MLYRITYICVEMLADFKHTILQATGAKALYEIETIQSLWSGYGRIVRIGLQGSRMDTVVVKHVSLPDQTLHPRGWNTNLSHQRKLKSYKVETHWYQHWSSLSTDACRMPKCFGIWTLNEEVCMVLEDLDGVGYQVRKTEVSSKDLENCLTWLANFHACYMTEQPKGLWKTGTYWHLGTRPEELEAMEDTELKKAAPKIDLLLKESPYQTFVHGDAKLANFCFSNEDSVAAVDFQYVGGGCGMKDVAYFLGSCLYEADCENREEALLTTYFEALELALKNHHKSVDFKALENNWRALFPVAWTDFHRFLKGWSPGHWKINSYSERMEREVLDKL